jgi:anti-sigma28 factor (negative regulator of flagellin synthesis)
MNSIHGIQPPMGPKPVESVEPPVAAAPTHEPIGVSDVVEISQAARLAAQIHELPEVRTELVERVKEEIAAGQYETSERIDATVDRLMDELFGQI